MVDVPPKQLFVQLYDHSFGAYDRDPRKVHDNGKPVYIYNLEQPPNALLVDVLLLCTECQQPIKARINTQQWIRVEWIGPEGECLSCYQAKKREQEQEREVGDE